MGLNFIDRNYKQSYYRMNILLNYFLHLLCLKDMQIISLFKFTKLYYHFIDNIILIVFILYLF